MSGVIPLSLSSLLWDLIALRHSSPPQTFPVVPAHSTRSPWGADKLRPAEELCRLERSLSQSGILNRQQHHHLLEMQIISFHSTPLSQKLWGLPLCFSKPSRGFWHWPQFCNHFCPVTTLHLFQRASWHLCFPILESVTLLWAPS